jgi:hypothetical protein
MSSLLKDIYSKDFYNNFSKILVQVIPAFNKDKFLNLIFDKSWQSKELKERMKKTSLVLRSFFPDNFEQTAEQIEKIITLLRQRNVSESSLEYMFLPDYIENYGIDHFDISVKSFEFITQFTSCEFAVRPFIIK